MANPTSAFGWQMPTSTDLVTDLPADFETFGQAVDTSLADLKGGTTGQVLAKNSNTDMDFVWVAQDDSNAIQNTIVDAKGDIITATAADVPARLPIGSNGQVLKVNTATSTGLEWATDNSGMTNPMTTTGDTIYSSSGSTPARLGIGSSGQVLTVSGGLPSWQTPAGGGMTLLATTTLSGTSTTISSISGSYKNILMIFRGVGAGAVPLQMRINGLTTGYYGRSNQYDNSGSYYAFRNNASTMDTRTDVSSTSGNNGFLLLNDYASTNAANKLCQFALHDVGATSRLFEMNFTPYGTGSTAITSVTFISAVSLTGTVLTYGVY